MAVYQLIMENVEDKNPKDNNGWKPLHSAAWNGHMPVCQLIMENIEDKNPKDNNGWTPLDYAASNGHLATICQGMFLPFLYQDCLSQNMHRSK